jgi:HK97 family phage major capsid protein
MGAQLYDRENVSVTVSSENADNFERGVLTFRADERVALEVSRPESFVIGTWTTPV